jgi:hypothetical protein
LGEDVSLELCDGGVFGSLELLLELAQQKECYLDLPALKTSFLEND